MDTIYNQELIAQTIKTHICEHLCDSSLKTSALEAVFFKEKDFQFSKMTWVHLGIWEKERSVENELKIMASIELNVLACDILDDLQDMDEFTTPWMKMETKFAMNLHFLFMTLSKQLIQSTTYSQEKQLALLSILSKYEVLSVNGQDDDLKKERMTEEEYLKILTKKSGSFMALACRFGSMDASVEKQGQIHDYGVVMGIVAQMENDLLGISKEEGYKDLRFKEISIPILFLLQHDETDELQLNAYYNHEIEEEVWLKQLQEPNKVDEYLKKTGVKMYGRLKQRLEVEKLKYLIEVVYTEPAEQKQILSILFPN